MVSMRASVKKRPSSRTVNPHAEVKRSFTDAAASKSPRFAATGQEGYVAVSASSGRGPRGNRLGTQSRSLQKVIGQEMATRCQSQATGDAKTMRTEKRAAPVVTRARVTDQEEETHKRKRKQQIAGAEAAGHTQAGTGTKAIGHEEARTKQAWAEVMSMLSGNAGTVRSCCQEVAVQF